VVVESSSEEEEEDSSKCDTEDMVLFMKKFKKYIKKKKFSKGDKKLSSWRNSRSSLHEPTEHATIVVSMVTSLLIVPLSIEMMMMTRTRASPTRRTRATKGVTSPTIRSPRVKLTLIKNGSPMMRAPTLIVMVWQPLLSREHLQSSLSSQSSIKGRTHASWWRRVSVR
jgi:hypothetical protein